MKVFLSYALSDREWVTRFAARLRDDGAAVSSWSSGFCLGSNPPKTLEHRMAAVDFVVLVLSDGFLAHAHVLDELGVAKLLGKPITSVLIEPVMDGPEDAAASASNAARRVREFAAGG